MEALKNKHLGNSNFSHNPFHTSKISNPAISRIPMKEAPWRLVLSKALFMRITNQRNSRS